MASCRASNVVDSTGCMEWDEDEANALIDGWWTGGPISQSESIYYAMNANVHRGETNPSVRALSPPTEWRLYYTISAEC